MHGLPGQSPLGGHSNFGKPEFPIAPLFLNLGWIACLSQFRQVNGKRYRQPGQEVRRGQRQEGCSRLTCSVKEAGLEEASPQDSLRGTRLLVIDKMQIEE